MKKIFSLLISAVVSASMLVPACAANKADYTITVNGKNINAEVYTEDGSPETILVPVRTICEELGFKVEWNPEEKTVFLDNGEMNATLTIDEDLYFTAPSIEGLLGASLFSLGVAPTIIDNTTYIPVKIFQPLFGNSDNIITVQDKNVVINTKM